MAPAQHAGLILAPRWRRFVATLVDFALVPALAFVLMWVTGVLEHAAAWAGSQPILRAIGLVLAAYLILNAWLLARSGQTVGKRALGLRIVVAGQDAVPPFWRLLERAFALPALAISLPAVAFSFGADAGGLALLAACLLLLVDALLACGPKRRCLHDYLIGSTVVSAVPRG